MKLQYSLGQFSQENGFTLIEILIVVAIIGILVAIAIPAVNTVKADSQEAKAATVIRSIETAKTRYVLKDAGALPDSSTPALLSEFGKYIMLKGVVSPTEAELLRGTGHENGTLETGTYQGDVDAATPASFGISTN